MSMFFIKIWGKIIKASNLNSLNIHFYIIVPIKSFNLSFWSIYLFLIAKINTILTLKILRKSILHQINRLCNSDKL